MYWKIGGCDERLSGSYYGTTGDFHNRLFKASRGFKTLSIPLTLFCEEDIKDAVTKGSLKRGPKNKVKNDEPIRILSFPYIQLK
jgi:hypothetical protein